jgi:YVTN family beta-propeller protein
MMRKTMILFTAALAASCAQAQQPAPAPVKSATAKGLLIVGNKAEDTVSFIDLASGRELGRSPTGRAPHEIAISPDGRQAAVVNYFGTAIDVYDIASRARVRTVDLSPGQSPHGLVWLNDGRLIAATERSRSVTVIDTKRGFALSSVPTDQQGSHMVVVSPDGKLAYTGNMGSGTVSVLNLETKQKVRDFTVGGRPEGIALNKDGSELWVADLSGSSVQAFDTRDFKKLAELETGKAPIRVLTSPDGRWVITSNLDSGTVTVIDAKTRQKVRDIVVSGEKAAGQITLAFSADGKLLYVAETSRDTVAEVDFATGKVLRRLQTGRNGDGLAVTS